MGEIACVVTLVGGPSELQGELEIPGPPDAFVFVGEHRWRRDGDSLCYLFDG